eukprot:TRINITY_DN13807_c0_g1_i2.p1 TRINITY_DN13807_c0_g1~~TRINITY_DN13807_c0_g1_i2.p1  ORF type:complete len:631 (-),score=149.18 TRINITY_DN13807_c0_g1_i2:109-2001(-)
MKRVFTLVWGLVLLLSLSLQVAQSDDHADYTYEIQMTKPDVIKVGEPTTLTFQVIDNVGRAQRWVSLCTEHERNLHVMVIGEDLDSFFHIHPEDFDKRPGPDDTEFSITLTFELSGRYLFMVNALLPSLTTGQCEEDHADVVHTEAINYWTKPGTQTPDSPIIVVSSSSSSDKMAGLNDDFSLGARIGILDAPDGVYTSPLLLSRTRLITTDDAVRGKYVYVNATMWNAHGKQMTQPVVGNCTVFAFDISDHRGAPVTTLQPFLGAIAHFAIAQEGLGTSAHAHGEITMAPGVNATAEQIAASQSQQAAMDFAKARCGGGGGGDGGMDMGGGGHGDGHATSTSHSTAAGKARVLEGHHMEVPAAFGPRFYLSVQFTEVGYHEIVGQIRVSKDEVVYFDLAIVAEKAKTVGQDTGIDGPFTPPTSIPTVEPSQGNASGNDGMKSGVIAAIVVGVLILILGIGFIIGLNYQHHRRKKYAELEKAGAVPSLQRGSVPTPPSTRLQREGDVEAGSPSRRTHGAGLGAAALASGVGSALGVDVVDTAGSHSTISSSSTDLDHESQSEFSEQDVVIFDRDRPTNAQPVPVKDKQPSRDITDIDSDDYDPALHAGLREQLDISGIDTSDLQNISLDN